MRCPDCGKFVSFDTEADPEEVSAELAGDGTFTAEYRRVLNCAECGQELKDAQIQIEVNIQVPEFCTTDEDHEWELNLTATPTERVQDTDRRGKPITRSRYMKRFYGVEVSGTATCAVCNAEVDVEASADEQASGFNELV